MVLLANLKDIEEISNIKLEVQKEAWGEEYSADDSKLLLAYKKYFKHHLNKDCFVFVKKVDGKIVALSILLIQNSIPYCKDLNDKYGYITSVNTLKDYRNRGYQHELMQYLINFAKKRKLNTLKLDSSNQIAIKMYKKYNFKILENDRVIMVLYL